MKVKVFKGLIVLIGITMLSGCAGYNINYKGTGPGYDVFRPDPYLLIKPGEKGATAEIVWLPNYTERYRIDTWNFLAKADFEFEFQDGWRLSKISDKSDNTTLASKLAEIAQSIAKPETAGIKPTPQQPSAQFELYRLEYSEKGFISLTKVPIK